MPLNFHIPLPLIVPFTHSYISFTHGCIYSIFPGSLGATLFFPSFRFPINLDFLLILIGLQKSVSHFKCGHLRQCFTSNLAVFANYYLFVHNNCQNKYSSTSIFTSDENLYLAKLRVRGQSKKILNFFFYLLLYLQLNQTCLLQSTPLPC